MQHTLQNTSDIFHKVKETHVVVSYIESAWNLNNVFTNFNYLVVGRKCAVGKM